MEEVELTGVVSKKFNEFILTTEEGKEYKLFAINPWESVPTNFDTAKFEQFVGESVKVSGRLSGSEIWNALVHCPDEADTKAPSLDDLIIDKKEKE
ncbi:MAG: hypothetical protein ACTSUW_03630 [Candidatus Heimdallarchaeota archaeon]|nr:hypothetical protein [Candidatus Heimdallarchaeota archaeon]MCK4290982.1 hypothetical protein [Candidatus Heimdallarchaeota archaeon]